MKTVFLWSAALALTLFHSAAIAARAQAGGDSAIARSAVDEVIYFLLPDRFENGDPSNDRGGLEGDRLVTGFDPAAKGFYHGGDLKGLATRLDYIKSLGATAIWLGPIYKNKPVQGPPGDESAGYHGYWITDFTRVDPHYGDDNDLHALVDAAHKRGMKVYLDIITNHTADVIAMRECHDPEYKGADKPAQGCPYRSKADYPYSRRGGLKGEPINPGFMGDQPPMDTPGDFSALERFDYAYTPYVPEGEENAKTPAWLNDVRYYHNRGDSNWVGESALYGDFSGLDDLFTEDPRVVDGMIEIYGAWIDKFKIDGFRIDTARHVAPEFWRPFVKAMLDRASANGIDDFYIFGEAYDITAAGLARHTRVDKLPYVLDFAFQSATEDFVVNGAPASRLADLFRVDALYEGGDETATRLPVFVGNHDMGRIAAKISAKHAGASDDEKRARIELAHAMMFFLRGVPVIYAGDEQGFNGDGNDQAAREDMFASRVASYNDNDLVGTKKTTAVSNFDPSHPLFLAIAAMAKTYRENEGLRRWPQLTRDTPADGQVFAASRIGETGEYFVAFNAGATAASINVAVDPRSTSWKRLHGRCPAKSAAPGVISVTAPPFGYIVCRSNQWNVAQ